MLICLAINVAYKILRYHVLYIFAQCDVTLLFFVTTLSIMYCICYTLKYIYRKFSAKVSIHFSQKKARECSIP